MIRVSAMGLSILAMVIGCCGGLGGSRERDFYHAFVARCAPADTLAEQKEMCACAANEVIETRTPDEWAALLAAPEEELRLLAESCAPKASGR